MKRFALPILIALLSVAACAQSTTYNIVGGPYHDGYYPPYLYSFDLQLNGTGNYIYWVAGDADWACGNGKPSSGGFIFYYLNGVEQPCANSTAYATYGTVTINFSTKPYTCSGPAKAVETFDDNSTLTVYYTYVHGGRYHNICAGEEIAGTFVTTP